MLKEGDIAPPFCLPNEKEEQVCLDNYKGKWVVVYFYPKDNTPGCTTEACDFSTNVDFFTEKDAIILGISADSIKSHKKFKEKKELKITLLSDPEHKVMEAYGVWKPKKLYGKTFLGIVRSTFLIDPDGKIAKVWSKVRVKNHVEEVKNSLLQLMEIKR
ncbi:MAG: thioredoxin-dependent thiol peroxidase [Candidatus Heimdallarchaeaceae archaeon]